MTPDDVVIDAVAGFVAALKELQPDWTVEVGPDFGVNITRSGEGTRP